MIEARQVFLYKHAMNVNMMVAYKKVPGK